jgi:hypothetical protein
MTGHAVLSRITADLTQSNKKKRTAVINEQNRVWPKVRNRIEPVASKEQEIKTSPRFNVHEKAHRLTTLSRDLDESVSMLEKERNEAAAKLERLKAMLAVVPVPAGDSARLAIREAEARGVLRGMSEGQRVQLFLRSAEIGDSNTLHLFIDSPLPLLSDVARLEGLSIYHERFSTVTFQAAQDTEAWLEHVSSLHEHTVKYVEALQTGSDLK